MTGAEIRSRFLQEREFWFSSGDFRMRYLHLPAVDKKSALTPIVFIHGLMGYSFSWRHNLDCFAHRREAYAIDLIGTGHSDHPPSGAMDFSLSAVASRLLDLLRFLGHPQFDLVATSHGGAAAMMAACQASACNSSIIRRMALIAPAHPLMSSARIRLAFFRTALGRVVARRLASCSPELRLLFVRRLYGSRTPITPETIAGYAVNLEDRSCYEYATEVIRTWHWDMKQLQDALPSIASIPVLLLWGDEDRAVSAGSGKILKQYFHNAEYIVLPHVGHLPYEEAPEEFNRIVLTFLNRE